jgi:hypothetical protein
VLSGLGLLAVPAFSVAVRDLWPSLGRPLADQRLAAIRGGFTTRSGAHFSIGIERQVAVNGEVVAITRFVLENLQNLMLGTTPAAQFATTLGTVVQLGAGNAAPGATTVQGNNLAGVVGNTVTGGAGAVTPPAVAAASPQVAAAAAPAAGPATATAVAPATTAASAPAAAAPVQTVQPATPAATPQPLIVQMTVNGQVVQVPSGASALAPLTVQNTLNDLGISIRTQIDASMSSMSALQSGQFATSLRQQILDSTRR